MKIQAQTTGWQMPRTDDSRYQAASPFDRVLRSRTAVKSDQATKPGPDQSDEQLRLLAVMSDAAGLPGLPELGAGAKAEETSPGVAAAATVVVRNLAMEILQEVRARKGADGQSVEMQFDSRTLDGLSVHISGIESTLSITFATQSAAVEALLSQHSTELIDRLRRDGFTIDRIGIERKRPADVNRSEPRQWKHSA